MKKSKKEQAARKAAAEAVKAVPAYLKALEDFRASHFEHYKRVYEAGKPLRAARRNPVLVDAITVYDAELMKEELGLYLPPFREHLAGVRDTPKEIAATLKMAEEEDFWD